MIAIELTAALDAAGTAQTFYVADHRFITRPTGTPASTAFDPIVLDPGRIGRHAYSDGRTGGATRLETGEIVLVNVDGALDGWLNYSFDGRPVVIRDGNSLDYPAGYTALMTGTAEGIEAGTSTLIIRLRDAQWRLDLPLAQTCYAGSNVLPAGLEGQAQDIKGQRKPRVYGKVFNVSPPFVNTSRLIFETGICNSVDAVYDRGVALAAGAAYVSQADMETNAPAAGQYRAWPAGGYARLGSTPTGQVTADLTQGAAAGNRTVAQIIRQIALDIGLAAGEISAADVAALDAANSAVVGIWIQDETTALQAMDTVAASIGAWFGFDRSGVLRMGQLTAPAGVPAATLNDYDVLQLERRPARDIGLPTWRITVGHSRNYTPQPSDLAGSVTADRRVWLAAELRYEQASDAAIKTQWRLADEAQADGLLTTAAAASAEAARRLALYKVRRDILEVTVPSSFLRDNASLELMSVVQLIYPRFGCAAGRLFRLIGMTFELKSATAVLSLWG